MTNKNNDENWSHIRETILLINVASARIEHAMVEGDDSFTKLSQSFLGIVDSAEEITHLADNLEDNPATTKINKSCKKISNQVSSSIIAFQFYDRLSQRMALISKSLNSLTNILEDPNKTHTQDEWTTLQNVIRSKYTLDADQEMFDAVLNGVSIDDALKIALKKNDEEEIEFF